MSDTAALWVETAARIFCEQQLTDYLVAKRKAQSRLGLTADTPMPDNASVEAAVLRYQHLYGGPAYRQHLEAMRVAALKTMDLTAPIDTRLVGAAVSGAVTGAHRVQLHALVDDPVSVDFRFLDLGIPYDQDERRYKFTDGVTRAVPLLRFEAGTVGIDLAVFEATVRARPLCPVTGRAAKRLDRAKLTALMAMASDPHN